MKHKLDFCHDTGGWYVQLADMWIPISWSQCPQWCLDHKGPLQCSISIEPVEEGNNFTTVAIRITDVEPMTDSLVVAGISSIVKQMRG